MLSSLFAILTHLLLGTSVSKEAPSYKISLQSNLEQHDYKALNTSLDKWLREEEDVALSKLLANIAPGLNTDGVPNGTVIASPSKIDPDYFYQCNVPLNHQNSQKGIEYC